MKGFYPGFLPLRKTLTDFKNCERFFAEAFELNQEINSPIKYVLELGINRVLPESKLLDIYPGQSTKTLFILHEYFNFEKMVSIDIDNCQNTIELCKVWCQKIGMKIPTHKFVQINSIEYDVISDFPYLDFVFLDTNHDDDYPERLGYEGSGGAGMTYKEICHYAPYLSQNGRLFLHDTKNYYVNKQYGWNTEGAVEKFLDENNEFVFIEHHSNENGLGQIIRKDSEVYKKVIFNKNNGNESLKVGMKRVIV